MLGKILQPCELLHHDLKVLYDYWREKKGSAKAPSRGHIANDTDDRYVSYERIALPLSTRR
jgi:hypothetical protein